MCATQVLGLAGCAFGSGESSAEPTDAAISTVTASSASSASSASTESPATSASPSPDSPAPSPSSSSASASPSPVPVTGPEQKLVTMTVSGGFAGVSRQVVLRGDGTVRVSDKGETVVRRTSAAQFGELRTLLGDPALAEVSEVTIDMGAADRFQYTLRFDGRTVMTDRSAEEPPLDRLIDALSEWLPTH
ncbi:hypothetical protein ADK57_10100 [Streptomyces sp. MMG1533]|uniref:hypothetical protein n=1 Tax=Streptomyces sp. MMG1533 TaxID=1415546 RepID=UPI0006C2886E|nr:hypothetical protein [Streptomyces sp. MMG1533]KOU72294.1 hypothetical protein ADK57_10100 [Streptomyces sp. MMG1533]